jgi:hypothetical protein
VKTPTWGEVREFLRIDGWEADRDTGHDFYVKVLEDGTELSTHVSFADDKTMSPGRFAYICRTQLRITVDAFWEVLRSGRPVPRPSPVEAAPPTAIPVMAARGITGPARPPR